MKINFNCLFFLGCFALIISCKDQVSVAEMKAQETILKSSLAKASKKIPIDTIFYDDIWDKTTREKALYFRPLNFEKKDSLWVVKDYYITGELQYEAYSLSKTEEIWEGEAIWYAKDGAVSGRTSYFKGIEETPDNLNKIEQEKIYATHKIKRFSREVLVSKETGYLLNDTVADYVFLFDDDNTDKIPNKRLVIHLYSEEGLYYVNELNFDKDNYLHRAYISDKRLILECKDERSLTTWQRTLIFKLSNEGPDEEGREVIYGDYEPYFILQEDLGFAKYPAQNKKITAKKDIIDFGDPAVLGEINFNDSTDNYTWKSLQKATNFQDYPYKPDDKGFELVHSFLESIENNKTIHLKKGVYNFSKISYERISGDKKISVNHGILDISGYSNIKFIGEKGVYFVSNDTHSPVIDFWECNNISVSKILAVHNVKETFCYAPVFALNRSNNITFDDCIADGSGIYGFHIINGCDSIKILNTTITNCSQTALYTYTSNVVLDNVEIINNEFDRNIIDVGQNSSVELNNCVFKNNTTGFYNHFDVDRGSTLKIKNSLIDATNDTNFRYFFSIHDEADDVIVENSTIILNDKKQLFYDLSPKFIECDIIEN